MNRKIYQPTAEQEQKWALVKVPTMPTDDEFRARRKKGYGKVAGWGIGKQNWIVRNMKNTREYQMGIWQGRVDAANDLDYQEPWDEAENASCYSLGYYRGYVNFTSDFMDWDSEMREQFFATYVS